MVLYSSFSAQESPGLSSYMIPSQVVGLSPTTHYCRFFLIKRCVFYAKEKKKSRVNSHVHHLRPLDRSPVNLSSPINLTHLNISYCSNISFSYNIKGIQDLHLRLFTNARLDTEPFQATVYCLTYNTLMPSLISYVLSYLLSVSWLLLSLRKPFIPS